MKELSVHIDESGDFGELTQNAPYYLVALVLHDQSQDISDKLRRLDAAMQPLGFPKHAIHTAPLVRREGDYINLEILERKRIFNRLFLFALQVPFTYKLLAVDKRKLRKPTYMNTWLSKQLMLFLLEHLSFFNSYDKITVYYDNGQMELARILFSLFGEILNGVEFRKIMPVNYRLAQVADLICTLELLSRKADEKVLTRSERAFFINEKELYRNYLRHIRKKQLCA